MTIAICICFCCKTAYRGSLFLLYASRANLLMRFRSLALGKRRRDTENIHWAGTGASKTAGIQSICHGDCKKRCPASKSEAIRYSRHSRSDLCNVAPSHSVGELIAFLFVDVPFVRNTQFFASFATAAGQYFTAIFGLHALTKTVLIFSLPFGGLKRPFHHLIIWERKDSVYARNAQSVHK